MIFLLDIFPFLRFNIIVKDYGKFLAYQFIVLLPKAVKNVGYLSTILFIS